MPRVPEALNAIERVVAEDELESDVVTTDVGTGIHPGFFGSPTVLVDGEDLFPARPTGAPSCRLYETPEGKKHSPTDAMLRAAIGERIGAQAEIR